MPLASEYGQPNAASQENEASAEVELRSSCLEEEEKEGEEGENEKGQEEIERKGKRRGRENAWFIVLTPHPVQ